MTGTKKILTFEEYAGHKHEVPYIVDVRRADSRLILFGCLHTTDPRDPTFDRIESVFARFAPDYAMHEGTPPAPEPIREVAIRRHGESGLVTHLAARSGIETTSMDIPLPIEARMLRSRLSQREALVFLVVRQLASFNRKTARMDFDGYFGDFFDLIAEPLGASMITWPLIECLHRQITGRELLRQEISGHETNPMRDELLTQRIATLSNRLRDEYMLGQLTDALAQHHRVFATVGVTHAVMLEPALRSG